MNDQYSFHHSFRTSHSSITGYVFLTRYGWWSFPFHENDCG